MLSYEESTKASGGQDICIGDDIGDVGNIKNISFVFPVFDWASVRLRVKIIMFGAVGSVFVLAILGIALMDNLQATLLSLTSFQAAVLSLTRLILM